MRLSLVLPALAATAAQAVELFDLTGAYWDASVTTQTGRPGYEIKDVNVAFYNPLSTDAAPGSCHYSFVPNNGRPAITDTCEKGLGWSWDYTTLTLTHKVLIKNETVTMYGSAALTSQCSGSGSAGGRTCKSVGKVELDHYCRTNEEAFGCYPPNGNACGDQCA